MNNIKEIKEVLETEGVFVSTTAGMSMYPMIRNRKDVIVVKKCTERLKKYDVALYKVGDNHILHRVLEVSNYSYVIRGDNCDRKEYGIKDEQILGVLTEFYRGDKKVNLNGWTYKIYIQLYCVCTPIRWVLRLGFRVIRKGIRIFRRRDKETCDQNKL